MSPVRSRSPAPFQPQVIQVSPPFFLLLPLGRPLSLPQSCIRRINSFLPHFFVRAATLFRPITLAALLTSVMHYSNNLTLAGRGAETPGSASTRTGKAGPRRSVRRCHLRERQKRGFAVGPTRRGKSTKIIAVAADNSLPLAVSVDGASPAECQLVEYVLAGSFLDRSPSGSSATRPMTRTRSTARSTRNTRNTALR
jgi:hypothetical protein